MTDSRLRKMAFLKTDARVILVPVGDRFRIEPFDDLILDGKCEEVVALRAVVADELPFHVLIQRQIEALVIFYMYEIHVEITDAPFL